MYEVPAGSLFPGKAEPSRMKGKVVIIALLAGPGRDEKMDNPHRALSLLCLGTKIG